MQTSCVYSDEVFARNDASIRSSHIKPKWIASRGMVIAKEMAGNMGELGGGENEGVLFRVGSVSM